MDNLLPNKTTPIGNPGRGLMLVCTVISPVVISHVSNVLSSSAENQTSNHRTISLFQIYTRSCYLHSHLVSTRSAHLRLFFFLVESAEMKKTKHKTDLFLALTNCSHTSNIIIFGTFWSVKKQVIYASISLKNYIYIHKQSIKIQEVVLYLENSWKAHHI